MTPSRLRRAVLAAAVVAAALPAAASGATTTEFELSLPKGDARVEQLELKASCSSACTLKPEQIGAVATTAGGIGVGEQLPGGFEGPLKVKAKQLKAGKPHTFKLAVPATVSRQIGGALARRNVVYLSVTTTVTPSGEPSYPAVRQAAIHTKGTKATAGGGTDDIVPAAIDRSKGNPRYAVTVEGTQTTTWSYNRDEDRGDGCRIIANGSGKEDLVFTTPKPVETEILRDKRGKPSIVSGDPYPFARIPVRISATRDGTRNAGMEGSCGVPGGGGCDPLDPFCIPGGQAPCTREGALNHEVVLSYSRRTGRLNAASNMWGVKVPPDQKPDCPVEQWAGYDWHLLDADRMQRSDPKIAGDAKKFIVQERRSLTRKIDGGSVKVSIRWVITFRKLS